MMVNFRHNVRHNVTQGQNVSLTTTLAPLDMGSIFKTQTDVVTSINSILTTLAVEAQSKSDMS